MDISTTARDSVPCMNCNAQAGQPCTAPTTSGRKDVNWLHDARWDAYRAQPLPTMDVYSAPVKTPLTLWQVTCHILTANGSVHLPTFYLDAQVQGILTAEHACKVARDIILPRGFNPMGYPVNVSAMAIHYTVSAD